MALIVKCILPSTLKYKEKACQLNLDQIFIKCIQYVNHFDSHTDIGVKTIKTVLSELASIYKVALYHQF